MQSACMKPETMEVRIIRYLFPTFPNYNFILLAWFGQRFQNVKPFIMISRRSEVLVHSPNSSTTYRQKLFKRNLGQTCIRDSYAELGHGSGGPETSAAVHRRINIWFVAATFTATDLAHSLVTVCVLQSSERSWFDHWTVFIPEAVLKCNTNNLSMDPSLFIDRRHN